MKTYFQKIILLTLVSVFIFGASAIVLPHQATAQTEDTIVATEAGLNSDNPSFWIDPISGIVQTAVAWIAITILKFASLLTGLGGVILNNSIKFTIVDVKDNYESIKSIDVAWKVIRDVSNMAFIFVLLYAAIQTILGIGKDTQKLIVRVVAIAILINFSLFFTKVVIDISNVMALTFYDAMVPVTAQQDVGNINSLDKGVISAGISDAFMKAMNLQNLYKLGEGQTLDTGGVIGTGIMGTILLLIAAFIFFAIALMFLIRYVILILVLILSPIAFIAFVLPHPEVGKIKTQWMDALLGQAFFAPIYMMLTWITLKVLNGITTSNIFKATGDLTTLNNPAATVAANQIIVQGFFGTLMNYIVVIIFLVASLLIAKQSAGKLPGGAGKLVDSAMGFAGSSTLGMAGGFGRGTIGRAGASLGESERFKSMASKGGATGMTGRLALATGRKTGGASFDMRNTGVGSTLGAGKGNKGGFTDDRKKKAEDEAKFAGTLGPSAKTTARAGQELRDIKDESHETDGFEVERKKAIENQRETVGQKKKELEAKEQAYIAYRNKIESNRNNIDPKEEKRLYDERQKVRDEVAQEEDYQKRMGSGTEGYKAVKVDRAQKKIDEIKGVDDDRAKEILSERMRKQGGKTEEEIKKHVNSKDAKADLDKIKADNKSAGDVRKEEFAKATEKSAWAKFRGYNYEAAAQIRKGKKGAKELIEEALKDTGEKKDAEPAEEKPAEGGDEAKPA